MSTAGACSLVKIYRIKACDCTITFTGIFFILFGVGGKYLDVLESWFWWKVFGRSRTFIYIDCVHDTPSNFRFVVVAAVVVTPLLSDVTR